MSFSAASLRAVLQTCVPAEAGGLVVALSGGPDSAALLAAAAAIGSGFRGLPVRAVHVDHGLQPAAADFRNNCDSLCKQLQVPLSIIAVEVRTEDGASLEAAARTARYAALGSQLRPGECLLTAHHREDQAETFLQQAFRGAGLKGISAMPTCRELGLGWHVRPLLEVAGADLRQFGAAVQNFYCIDPMNQDLRFDRVHLRREIWPPIERRWPGAAGALARAAGHAAEAQQLLEGLARTDLARLRDGDELSVLGLRILPAQRRANVVRLWLMDKGLELPSAARLGEALRQMLEADADQQPAIVWGGKALRRYRQRIFVTDANPPRLDARTWETSPGSCLDLGPQLGSLTWIAQRGGIDPGSLPPRVSVRPRAGGETLRPGMQAKTQSLQHLCQTLGVLPWMRDALPLIFSGDELIAVADLWVDADWRVADAPGLGIAWQRAPWVT